MILDDNQQKVNLLLKSNPELKALIDKTEAESRQILSRFTHELRNPLTLVRSTIQLIESQHPEVVDYKYWNQLISDLDDTVSLLNELSLYNHCDQLDVSTFDLTEFITRCIDNIKPYATSKQLSLSFYSDGNTSIYNTYHFDRIKMRQVLTNLLKNAVEAADVGTTIQVHLSVLPYTRSQNQYLELSITNSGNPIPTEELDHIFDPFVSFKKDGTGLGLAICKKIATLHNGSISVSQTEDTVTFSLLLPIDVPVETPNSVAL